MGSRVALEIEKLNDNEYQIYEEQIEDVIRALAIKNCVIIGEGQAMALFSG